MTTLASVTDVQNRMTRAMTSEELAAAPYFLQDASDAIRDFARQDFDLQTTTIDLRPTNSYLKLPQRPVVTINSVARVNPLGTGTIPYSLWVFDQIDRIYVGPIAEVINAPIIFADMSWLYRSVAFQVNYTHGYSTPPSDVVGLCADLVRRIILGPQPGVVGETIGSYSYRMVDGYQPGLISLTRDDKAKLRKYRSAKTRTIEIGG